MERLTIEYDGQFMPKEMCTIDRFGEADDCETCDVMCEEFMETGCTECPIQNAFARLAEYEDLGLMPNQIKELSNLYTEKCGQIKEIVKRLEKESEEARAGGHFEISGAYIRAIYIIKEKAEGYPQMNDDKLVDLAFKKAEVKEGGQQNE